LQLLAQWIQALKIKKTETKSDKKHYFRPDVRDAKINYYEKSPTTIPAPVIPFEDDPEYHDDDGDDTFGLLEDNTSADEAVCCCDHCFGQKKGCVGTPKVLRVSSRGPLRFPWGSSGSLWRPHR